MGSRKSDRKGIAVRTVLGDHMDRITERSLIGISVKTSPKDEEPMYLSQCFGGKPNPDYSNCEPGFYAFEKLAEYEDLEEQGKLLKIPCKSGDEVFIPIDFQEKIHHGIIVGVEYSKIRKCFVAVVRTDDEFLCYEKFEDFEKTVFLNRNQAEDALKKMIERNRYKHE